MTLLTDLQRRAMKFLEFLGVCLICPQDLKK